MPTFKIKKIKKINLHLIYMLYNFHAGFRNEVRANNKKIEPSCSISF